MQNTSMQSIVPSRETQPHRVEEEEEQSTDIKLMSKIQNLRITLPTMQEQYTATMQ